MWMVVCTSNSGNNITTNIAYISVYLHSYMTLVTGPDKRDQVGTKYTKSQNSKYLEFCVQYLVSVSCNLLPIKLFIYGTIFT